MADDRTAEGTTIRRIKLNDVAFYYLAANRDDIPWLGEAELLTTARSIYHQEHPDIPEPSPDQAFLNLYQDDRFLVFPAGTVMLRERFEQELHFAHTCMEQDPGGWTSDRLVQQIFGARIQRVLALVREAFAEKLAGDARFRYTGREWVAPHSTPPFPPLPAAETVPPELVSSDEVAVLWPGAYEEDLAAEAAAAGAADRGASGVYLVRYRHWHYGTLTIYPADRHGHFPRGPGPAQLQLADRSVPITVWIDGRTPPSIWGLGHLFQSSHINPGDVIELLVQHSGVYRVRKQNEIPAVGQAELPGSVERGDETLPRDLCACCLWDAVAGLPLENLQEHIANCFAIWLPKDRVQSSLEKHHNLFHLQDGRWHLNRERIRWIRQPLPVGMEVRHKAVTISGLSVSPAAAALAIPVPEAVSRTLAPPVPFASTDFISSLPRNDQKDELTMSIVSQQRQQLRELIREVIQANPGSTEVEIHTGVSDLCLERRLSPPTLAAVKHVLHLDPEAAASFSSRRQYFPAEGRHLPMAATAPVGPDDLQELRDIVARSEHGEWIEAAMTLVLRLRPDLTTLLERFLALILAAQRSHRPDEEERRRLVPLLEAEQGTPTMARDLFGAVVAAVSLGLGVSWRPDPLVVEETLKGVPVHGEWIIDPNCGVGDFLLSYLARQQEFSARQYPELPPLVQGLHGWAGSELATAAARVHLALAGLVVNEAARLQVYPTNFLEVQLPQIYRGRYALVLGSAPAHGTATFWERCLDLATPGGVVAIHFSGHLQFESSVGELFNQQDEVIIKRIKDLPDKPGIVFVRKAANGQ